MKDKYELKLASACNRSVHLYQGKMQIGEEKDMFEEAVSWKRAYAHLYMKVTRLNSYALTNSIAAQT